MLLADPAGNLTTTADDDIEPFEDRYQGHVFASQAALAVLFGEPSGPGAWDVVVAAADGTLHRAVIGTDNPSFDPAARPRATTAWEVTGADGTLGPVIRAVARADRAPGRGPRCGCPVRSYKGNPDPACGRPGNHNGPHRSKAAVARALRADAARRRKDARPRRAR